MIEKDIEWLESIRLHLEQGVDQIDEATGSKLSQIRRQALDKKTSKKFTAYFLPAAAIASACLVLALLIYIPEQGSNQNQNEMIDDLDLITTSESLDLFEDLEFYEWLEAYDLPS